MGEKVAILDAGAQYSKLIDKSCRLLGVESELLPLNTPTKDLLKYKAIIISGGPESVYSENAPEYNPDIFTLDIPVLGICYGMQLMNQHYRGIVEKTSIRQDGPNNIHIENSKSKLFQGLDTDLDVLLTHGDSVTKVAENFRVTAYSDGLVASIENAEKQLYGVQFHPESNQTPRGLDIFQNFLFNIAGCLGDYTPKNREKKAIQYIQEKVGYALGEELEKKVLVLVSGGVDSTVCASLLTKALGPENIIALHIDHGFMRKNESTQIRDALNVLGLELHIINAQQDFYNAKTTYEEFQTKPLCETSSPEKKRNIIGNTFINVTEKAIKNLGLDLSDFYLAMGTLRPDLIESASHLASVNGSANMIKTHHNDTELVRNLREKGRVIEPLSEYHKEEVRVLGKSLGLPNTLVSRLPFPGPGLAIRILCAQYPYITEEFDKINTKLEKLVSEEISATLLPIQTVGVQGDGRSYSYAVALSGAPNWNNLFELAKRIPQEIHQVNRVVYVFGQEINRPIKKITPTHLTHDVIQQVREADYIVNKILEKDSLLKTLSQVPVISIPVDIDQNNYQKNRDFRTIVIRPFLSDDFMTGVAARPKHDIPVEVLEEIVERILVEVKGISRVGYDLTSKPPGTTEWE